MSDTAALHEATAERVAGRFGLYARDSAPLSSLTTGAPLGEWSTLIGPELDKAVVCELTMDDGGQPDKLYLFHAFARPSALVPHLLLERTVFADSNGDAEQIGLLMDLAPRVDLGVNSGYVEEVYMPLTEALDGALAIEGVTRARVAPLRGIALSPWALSVRAPADRTDELEGAVTAYLDHWIAIVSGGVGASVDPVATDPTKLVQHDRYHREALFDENADVLWPRIYRVIGPNPAAELRMALRSQETR